MTLTTNQVRQIHENIEKYLAKSNDFRWTIQFDGGQWFVKDVSGNLICKFPEVPQKTDLNTMVSWGTATAPENMGSLWRSQLEYLADIVIPEVFDEIRGPGPEYLSQSQQAQQ
jgi:hypothetical protein